MQAIITRVDNLILLMDTDDDEAKLVKMIDIYKSFGISESDIRLVNISDINLADAVINQSKMKETFEKYFA